MRLTCPICKGHGWSDQGLRDVGKKPTCKMCNGIGTINLADLSRNNRATEENRKLKEENASLRKILLWIHGRALKQASGETGSDNAVLRLIAEVCAERLNR